MSNNAGLKIGVFAYNFVHRKTQDVLFRLFAEDVQVKAVFAANKVELDIPPSSVRTKVRHSGILHPEKVADACRFPFFNVYHDREAILELLNELQLDAGIVAGARILPGKVIDRFRLGVINAHPGLLPESRGLDAMLWSIYNDIPLGVTTHQIDRNVDAGHVLIRQQIPIYRDDTVFDLSERLYGTQLDLLKPSLDKLSEGTSDPIDAESTPFNSKMPSDLEQETLNRAEDYIRRHANETA